MTSGIMRRVRCLIALVVLVPTIARADCPTTPDDPVCRPWAALLMPSAFGMVYAPNDAAGPWYGGGLEAATVWSDNSQEFGPSHGKLRFDLGALRSTTSGAGTMVMYRGGAQVSFERNPSRQWLIPYFDFDVGGLWTKASGSHLFGDGGVGVYLAHRRTLVVDVELDGLLPFSGVDQLGGVRAQLSASFALW
jgi:hypothetical protein